MKISKEKCVCAYQQEEFLRPHPDTLSDLTAMPRPNQHVRSHQHEYTPKYHQITIKPLKTSITNIYPTNTDLKLYVVSTIVRNSDG